MICPEAVLRPRIYIGLRVRSVYPPGPVHNLHMFAKGCLDVDFRFSSSGGLAQVGFVGEFSRPGLCRRRIDGMRSSLEPSYDYKKKCLLRHLPPVLLDDLDFAAKSVNFASRSRLLEFSRPGLLIDESTRCKARSGRLAIVKYAF